MLVTVFSCSKKDATPSLTPTQMIIGKYLLTAQTTTENGVIKNELLSRLACAADDVVEFTADGKIIYTSGATKCDPTEISYSGTYTLSNGGKWLNLKFVDAYSSSEYGYEVITLTEKTLKFGNLNLVINGTTLSLDYTYTKI